MPGRLEVGRARRDQEQRGRQAHGTAWFDFADLCEQPLGPVDYLAIADRFENLIVAGVPVMGAEQRNEARRFNILIDTLYEAKVHLVMSADAPPEGLYPTGDGTFEFRRTISRLMEMQSIEYISARRTPAGALAASGVSR